MERRKFLTERCSITPDINQGIYPFKDMKLDRADVEWLLATHDNVHEPMDWRDEHQHERLRRFGLDLRGADLRRVDLSYLPLAYARGGLTFDEWTSTAEEQHQMAAVLMEDANLFNAHIQRAYLRGAHLERANLRGAHLEGTSLVRGHLNHANLTSTHLDESYLVEAHLVGANLTGAFLTGARLNRVVLGDENQVGPQLVDVRLVNWVNIRTPRLSALTFVRIFTQFTTFTIQGLHA